jgi:peptide/nickel transport system ATP-binding protein
MTGSPTPVPLRVERLSVAVHDGRPVVDDVSFRVAPGECLGVVGESGGGKTTAALATLAFARPGTTIVGGAIHVGNARFDARDERAMRRLRGRLLSYVPQDPAAALNPSLRAGDAILDVLKAHRRARRREEVMRALGRVHLPGKPWFARRYPHQLSGGQRQRLALAVALAAEPRVVILDEPTTGLDAVTQALLLQEIARLRREAGVTMVYITHDLAVVASIAERIAVMHGGRIVEEGATRTILQRARHPHTQGLIAAIPEHVRHQPPPPSPAVAPVARALPPVPGWAPSGPAPLLAVEDVWAEYATRDGPVAAVREVSFQAAAGECLAVVGASGSGKTTVARCVVGLHRPRRGNMLLDGRPLAPRARDRLPEARRRIQIVFQDPFGSLNPRHRVVDAVARPARILRGVDPEQARGEALDLLEMVRLPRSVARVYPPQLSGGERQRVAIARALAARPDLVVCDEITSSLDASVQAAVLDLLAGLRADLGMAILLISHDLGVVASIADRVLVLEEGSVREEGPTARVLRRPEHPSTRRLVEAAPTLPW